jgi:hypothetical protein
MSRFAARGAASCVNTRRNLRRAEGGRKGLPGMLTFFSKTNTP